jgi:hypothetical protein
MVFAEVAKVIISLLDGIGELALLTRSLLAMASPRCWAWLLVGRTART